MNTFERMVRCKDWLETQCRDNAAWTIRFDVSDLCLCLDDMLALCSEDEEERADLSKEMQRQVSMLWTRMASEWITHNTEINIFQAAHLYLGRNHIKPEIATFNTEISLALTKLSDFIDSTVLPDHFRELQTYFERCRF